MHENLENKKAERREADRKRQVQSASGDGQCSQRVVRTPWKRASRPESASDTYLYRQGVALPRLGRPVSADLPVDSIESGIIYMSRWCQDNAKHDDTTSVGTDNVASRADLGENHATSELLEARDSHDGDGSRDEIGTNKMQAQQKCSLALLNMTMRDQVLRVRVAMATSSEGRRRNAEYLFAFSLLS